MRILVTGVNGQLGYDVCRVLSDRHIEHRGVDVADFDLTDPVAVQRAMNAYRPDAVIHCAAHTAVDKGEDEPEAMLAVNTEGTKALAEAAAELGAKLLFVSTDYVFDGEGSLPRKPEDATRPLSVYGRSKALAEEAIRATLDAHFIVRTAWVFGVHGNNFVKTMLRLADTREEIAVVCDQIGSPTYSYDLARLLCDMIETDRYGTYHATNEGFCSWADFAAEIMRQSQKATRIRPIPSTEYPTRAKRPLNSRLSKDKLSENGFLRLPDWKDALTRFLKELERVSQ